MRLQILQVPDCPNAADLEIRLAQLIAGHADIEVTRQVVTVEDDAERVGMTGSPTLLVDGVDPFPRRGRHVGVAGRQLSPRNQSRRSR